MDNWWVYIVEKKTGLYVGITTDLENRMRQHGQPAPLYHEGPIPKADALKRERTLKGWSRKKAGADCQSLLTTELSLHRENSKESEHGLFGPLAEIGGHLWRV